MNQTQLFAYVDHNVIDLITKGDPNDVIGLLKKTGLTPVFSDENLAEIRRSKGFEKKFLEVFVRIEARYLVPILDDKFMPTGRAEIRTVNPYEAFDCYVENIDAQPDHEYGFSGLLEKFYGGRESQSYAEVISTGADELRELLLSIRRDLEDEPEIDCQLRELFDSVIVNLPEQMKEEFANITTQLDSQSENLVRRIDKEFELGPKTLNNIKKPDVLRKVWALVQKQFPDMPLDIDEFFGIKNFSIGVDTERTRTTLEKVDGIYHQLNLLGYYRDSKMAKQRRFKASFSDMTHAGLATFCHVLICRDEDLIKKAEAAYEFLGVETHILYFES